MKGALKIPGTFQGIFSLDKGPYITYVGGGAGVFCGAHEIF